MAAALKVLTLVTLLAALSLGVSAERKLLQSCASGFTPCYNAGGDQFKCCPGSSCGDPPAEVPYCAGELPSNPEPTAVPIATAPQGSYIQSGTPQPLSKETSLDQGFLNGISHVLIISVDGLHQVDVEYFLAQNPNSPGFGWLTKHGTQYTNAATTIPSDSYPGTMALLTGGTPNTMGIYYDSEYNRNLSPPGDLTCSTRGAPVVFDETIDNDLTKIDGGGGPNDSVNASLLPRDPSNGCQPVYPCSYPLVNNIFDVAYSHGLYTAFSDKSTGGYQIAQGKTCHSVSDYASLEIKTTQPQYLDTTGTADGLIGANGVPAYDAQKVQETLNWAKGYDHLGTTFNGFAPAIMYNTYQVVSVNQKIKGQGYLNDNAPPAGPVPSTYVQQAIAYVDYSLGEVIAQLDQSQILGTTLIIVTAKHGQSPIDPTLVKKIAPATVTGAIATLLNNANEPAHIDADDALYIYLLDSSKANAVRDLLNSNKTLYGIDQCFTYADLGYKFDDRIPDVWCHSTKGVIYTTGSKIAEHGGFADDDTHVPLIVANKYLTQQTYTGQVYTRQVPLTALAALGIDYNELQAVSIDGTVPLPDAQIY